RKIFSARAPSSSKREFSTGRARMITAPSYPPTELKPCGRTQLARERTGTTRVPPGLAGLPLDTLFTDRKGEGGATVLMLTGQAGMNILHTPTGEGSVRLSCAPRSRMSRTDEKGAAVTE